MRTRRDNAKMRLNHVVAYAAHMTRPTWDVYGQDRRFNLVKYIIDVHWCRRESNSQTS
jgi:hypothetical protein